MVKISSSFIFTTQAELNVAPEGPFGPVKILPSDTLSQEKMSSEKVYKLFKGTSM